MKKLIVLLLSYVLCLSLAACGSTAQNEAATAPEAVDETAADPAVAEPENADADAGNEETDTAEKTVVTFWTFHQGAENEFYQNAVKEFNETHDDVMIEHQVVSQSDYITTLIPTAYANGEAPDILFVEPSTFTKYAEKGMLADLSPYYTDALKADMQPSALEAATFDGQILALPIEMETLGLFYNADMLAEANIEPPTTWDELYEAARALTTDDVYGLVLPVEDSGYTLFNWWPFMWMNGADILSADRSQVVVDTPEMAAALDYWGRFYQEGLSPSSLQIGPWDIGNVGTGLAAMQVGGTYMILGAETTYADVNIQVVPFPAPDGKTSITVAGGQKLAINAQSENQDIAAEFIFSLYGDTDDISAASQWVTTAKFAYPARFSVIDANQDIYEQGMRKDFTAFYDTAVPEPSYSAEITEAVGTMLQSVMFGGVSGADAAKEAQATIEALPQ
jgi:multiple sugar transport system substrate-binding protein